MSRTDAAFRQVENLFDHHLRVQRLHPGAALAVYYRGDLVFSRAGGLADTHIGVPVSDQTLFVLMSASKPLAHTAVLQQIERLNLRIDAPVAAYWPEFAAMGKDSVTVRDILTHRSGIPYTKVAPKDYGDWAHIVSTLASQRPRFPIGTVGAYHGTNQGWLCAELVRRVDGRGFSQYLREEIAEPLGVVNLYCGIPDDAISRISRIHATEDSGSDPITGESEFWIGKTFNRVDNLKPVVPAANGCASAEALGRFYADLLDGPQTGRPRILSAQLVEEATAVFVDVEVDLITKRRIRRGLGFVLSGLGGDDVINGTESDAQTFGHNGAGTCVCWADKDSHTSMVYLTNGYRDRRTHVPRGREMSDAVRAAVAQLQ